MSAGRLKRRSSIGFPGARRDPESTFTDDQDDDIVDEEAERRERNLQRKQQLRAQHLDSPSSSQESNKDRRSVGGISGLTATQLAEHYNNCIKLSAENKISTKNAFNLQLIDYMAQMIRKKESDMSNFQVAAGTLDASTKIYAYRVDAVYGDTLKIAHGLGQSKKEDEAERERDGEDGDNEEDDRNQPDKKIRKRIKRANTVEKNIKNLNIVKFEQEFDVDPLFKKKSSELDGAVGGNQFLSTLEVRDETGELILDSESRLSSDIRDRSPTKGSVGSSTCEMLNWNLPETAQICETFSLFSFTTWSPDSNDDDEYNRLNESISASQEEKQKEQDSSQKEHAFDAFAVPEPVDDDGVYEDGVADNDYDDEVSDFSERAHGHAAGPLARGFTATLPMTTADMLSALTTAPLEYSYFDQGKLGAWAGPKHWKFKPMSRLNPDGEKTKGRKKKEIQKLDFDAYDVDEEKEKMDTVEFLLSKPKKAIMLVDKTMKGWNREKTTLPEDLHYSGHELVRLKGCDQIIVVGHKSAAEMQVDDVEDYDYDNPADRNDYCPDVDDDQDAYGGDYVSGGETMLGSSLEPNSQSDLVSQGEYGADDLVEAPKMVDKAALQIGYAKTAKKVDMKRIKAVTWNILTQDKENVGGSPEKVSEKEEEGKVHETSFSHIYRLLKQPRRLPPKMTENLSVPLAFLALLHLCNEQNLEIDQNPNLKDFTIHQA
ncbi:condensin complex subunit 2 isoform X2 [Eurytemora carolleeae]|uniref:condensin complex subunit 2 isoform X2 n=1 Tax=Eurytemora carolleeae TaxID=1294199 RepID=UPI000C780710|nr:condensin complex subunit 2 isoform X2 [Eurytemora carolleeae]|eukprot:XP_023323672.1 condensin complex subunit 2-like isoform X2 [Eurytemora affinis]